MDPNETLARIRALCADMTDIDDADAAELVELVGALDEWLSRGGFLPQAWISPGP